MVIVSQSLAESETWRQQKKDVCFCILLEPLRYMQKHTSREEDYIFLSGSMYKIECILSRSPESILLEDIIFEYDYDFE